MAPIVSLPLVFVLLLGFLGLIAAMNRMSWRRDLEVQNLLREIGQRHGLTYRVVEGENERMIDYVERAIHNPVHGFELTVYTRHHPLQMDKKIMGGELAFVPPLGVGLTLGRRGPWSTEGLRTGDARFDRVFFLDADHPEAAMMLLSPAVRQALVVLDQEVPEIELSDQRLTWSQYGAMTDADRLERIVAHMEDVAAALRNAYQRLAAEGLVVAAAMPSSASPSFNPPRRRRVLSTQTPVRANTQRRMMVASDAGPEEPNGAVPVESVTEEGHGQGHQEVEESAVPVVEVKHRR